jgi:hypothetical protein
MIINNSMMAASEQEQERVNYSKSLVNDNVKNITGNQPDYHDRDSSARVVAGCDR